MQNVEFKAELRDDDLARSIARALGARRIAILEQTDTYYRIADGRLKKRECHGEPTEWILYDRPNHIGNKLSTFHIYSDDEAAERYGDRHLRPWQVVKKRRELWMLDHTRIHFDEVEHLGQFIEFEALLSARQKRAEAEDALMDLRRAFAPAMGEALAVGYSDLLAAAEESSV